MFEGEEYVTQGNYDTYLKRLCGKDYMRTPPKGKQDSGHGFNMNWKTKQ